MVSVGTSSGGGLTQVTLSDSNGYFILLRLFSCMCEREFKMVLFYILTFYYLEESVFFSVR